MAVRSAIVLAAGEGKRLRPMTEHRPKPMLPAATRPILAHVFDALVESGITEIVVVVGYGRNRVQSAFGSTYREVPITYVTQDKQLGSGHALRVADSATPSPCLVVNGDQLVDTQILRDVVDGHDDSVATIGAIQHGDVTDYGGVLLERDETGGSPLVREIVENPRDDRGYLLNAGVYVLEQRAIDAICGANSRPGEHSLVDGLATLIEGDETVRGVRSSGLWIDATYPWDLLEVADALLEASAGGVDHRIASSARIHDSATIRGPVVIAEDCVVGPGAVVGPNVCLGENVTVGSNVVCEHSVIDADTRIGPNATLIDCVSGRGVRVGPGSTVVGGPGDVHVEDRIHRNEGLGALLADRVRDGGGVTYQPGTIVGSNAILEAGTTVRGTIDSETEVRS
ncbi:glucose-1-phosphate thymidylyltransferase [Natronorubrum sediminis]|uniref:Bifunctional protein GlmU n=1 Tax=Natronorubrum sediminis TaxID=640943 RepID=A0A1H6FXS1_9EURY|nr:sugar phosphate nucleotidyltransferase [Natronorubrum sediminis]SEH15597.1 glucose-1-phosphate thymidylyltransferase [Natronorubrum sediminis]